MTHANRRRPVFGQTEKRQHYRQQRRETRPALIEPGGADRGQRGHVKEHEDAEAGGALRLAAMLNTFCSPANKMPLTPSDKSAATIARIK